MTKTVQRPDQAVIVLGESEGSPTSMNGAPLEGRGMTVTRAGSGDSLIEVIDDLAPDVLLLQPGMTTSDGEDVLEVLSEDSAHMPVVVLASDDPEEVTRAQAMGAHDCVSPTSHEVTLLARINAAIELKRLRDEVARQRDTLSRLVRVDALTGLTNRTQLETQLQQLAANARRYDRDLSIVLFDLDRFGHINDIAGNDAGDMVLQDIARHLMADLRIGDIAGRWGSDQFMAILPETNGKGACVLAERLRLTISEFGAELPDGSRRPISASFGCASGVDANDLIRGAKASCVEAKRAGGNAVRGK